MPNIVVTIAGSLLLAVPLVGSAEESCPVEGITVRWVISYCMTRFETDDEAHPGVSDCFHNELQKRPRNAPDEDCEANLAYKSALCSVLIEGNVYDESLASCVASDEMVPAVVKNGIG